MEFAGFNLKKVKTGSFHPVKSVKVSTDYELLLQIAGVLKVVQTDIKDVKTRVTNLETRFDKQDEFNQYVWDVFKRNNLKLI